MKAKIKKALKYPDGYVDISPLEYDISGNPRNDYQYCTLLMEHAKECKYALEIGSSIGISARHIAEGLPEDGLLICVDNCVSVDSKTFHNIEKYKKNIRCIEKHSGYAFDEVTKLLDGNKLDMLFIDATHQFNFAYAEYLRYRELVKDGGYIFWDDLKLHPQMEYIWKNIVEYKHRDDRLHWTGFGWNIKEDDITPIPYDKLIVNCPRLN